MLPSGGYHFWPTRRGRCVGPSLVNFAIEVSEQQPQAPAGARNGHGKQDDVAGRHPVWSFPRASLSESAINRAARMFQARESKRPGSTGVGRASSEAAQLWDWLLPRPADMQSWRHGNVKPLRFARVMATAAAGPRAKAKP
jgi:hypothetical protein